MSEMPSNNFRQAHGGTVISPFRPEPAKGVNYPVPVGWGRLKQRVTTQMVQKCNEILKGREPKGTWIVIDLVGGSYLFAVEWHKHAATDNVPANLKEWHRGVTVYQRT